MAANACIVALALPYLSNPSSGDFLSKSVINSVSISGTSYQHSRELVAVDGSTPGLSILLVAPTTSLSMPRVLDPSTFAELPGCVLPLDHHGLDVSDDRHTRGHRCAIVDRSGDDGFKGVF